MNFALILVVLSGITGVIYLTDWLIWSKRRPQLQKPGFIIEQARSFFPVFIIVLLLRSFIIEPFRIPSGSLEPTLLVGDFLAVNKYIYGLRLPVWEKKIVSISHPKVGEIAVFRWPPNPKLDYIKRVIGTPGDKISYHNKQLTINGKLAEQKFIEYTIDEETNQKVAKYRENLNGVEHDIFIRPEIASQDFEIIVPENQYFMMGDNRDNSADSRYWGYVDDAYLRGRASLVWMSWNSKTASLRWQNIGKIIH